MDELLNQYQESIYQGGPFKGLSESELVLELLEYALRLRDELDQAYYELNRMEQEVYELS